MKEMNHKAVTAPPIDTGISKKERAEIAAGLSKLLADNYTLYLKTHNFHWNVTGPMFNTLHLMRDGYERAKAGEPGLAGYDRWFGGVGGAGPNNASISSIALYTGQVPAFKAILAGEGNDLPRFYARVKMLSALSKQERDVSLAAAARQAVATAP